MSSTYNYPQLVSSKMPYPQEIYKGEWATVTLKVAGDSRPQTVAVPTAVVLALDYSGSMDSDGAYQAVAAAAKAIVNQLTPGVDKVSIISIRDIATIDVPLTTSFTGLAQTIDGMSPDGNTNLQDGFMKANDVLKLDSSPNKIVILMSDGWTNTGYGGAQGQTNYFMKNTWIPVSQGIKYFTIGWGPEPNALLLDLIAEKTGGSYQAAPTQASLITTFTSAYQAGSHWLDTTMIDIVEVVDKGLMIRPGSLLTSFPSSLEDEAQFMADVNAAAVTFYSTNTLTIPRVHRLGASQVFTLFFDVTATWCSDQSAPALVDVDDPAAHVSYRCGQPSPTVAKLPQAQLKVKPCSVVTRKDLDEANNTVTLTVINAFNRPITDVIVTEHLTGVFTAVPPVDPRPEQLAPNGAFILWRVGDMLPDEKQTFTFQLAGTAAVKGKPGSYEVDAEGSLVAFGVDLPTFEVPTSDPAYKDFGHAVKTHAVTQATSDLFGHHDFHVPVGTFIEPCIPPLGTPPLQFGWVIDPGGWKFLVTTAPSGYGVYHHDLSRTLFPQKVTSAGYIPK